ncbi:MAG: glycosyltransferase [Flavobacteriales bacterium]|nr:glycosyltransferase [Flavobacteriales bacterium]
MKKIKVLRIINRFNVGGPTYNAAYLSAYLPETFETKLIGGSPAAGEAHSGYILDALHVPYEEIPEMSRSVSLLNDLRAFRKIRKIIKEYQPDIIHTHAAKAGALGRIAGWIAGTPVIVHTYHGHVFSGYFSAWKSRLVRFVERTLCKLTHHVVVISEQQFDEIVNHFRITTPQKAHIIPLGFDLNRFSDRIPEKRKAFREKWHLKEEVAIGIIGRIAPVKNHALFFDALRELRKKDLKWKALVIGDGEGKESMMQSLADFTVTDQKGTDAEIIFTSWERQVDEALAGLDIVVLTSHSEGTPVSLIEAQASHKPVVSTNAGGVRNCILPDKSGFITEMNAIDIANHIETLITDATLRESMGNAGHQFVLQKYHYSRLCADIVQLYESAWHRK